MFKKKYWMEIYLPSFVFSPASAASKSRNGWIGNARYDHGLMDNRSGIDWSGNARPGECRSGRRPAVAQQHAVTTSRARKSRLEGTRHAWYKALAKRTSCSIIKWTLRTWIHILYSWALQRHGPRPLHCLHPLWDGPVPWYNNCTVAKAWSPISRRPWDPCHTKKKSLPIVILLQFLSEAMGVYTWRVRSVVHRGMLIKIN